MLLRRREVEQRGGHRARLRDEREPTGPRRGRAERRVEADVRADHAERAGADQADAVPAGSVAHVRAHAAPARPARRRRHHDGRLQAHRAAPSSTPTTAAGGRGDDGELDRCADRRSVGTRGRPSTSSVTRIHGVQRAGEAAGEQVLERGASDRPSRSDAPTIATDVGDTRGRR